MKTLKEYIAEAKLDLAKMSNEDLIFALWSAWSGWETGKSGGYNNTVDKLSKFIDSKFGATSYYAMISEKIMDLDDAIRSEFGIDAFTPYKKLDKKVETIAKEKIKSNLEWLTSGKEEKEYKVK